MQCIELVREQTKAAIGDRREKANGEREGEREKASGEGGREGERGRHLRSKHGDLPLIAMRREDCFAATSSSRPTVLNKATWSPREEATGRRNGEGGRCFRRWVPSPFSRGSGKAESKPRRNPGLAHRRGYSAFSCRLSPPMSRDNFLTAPNWPQPLGMPPRTAQAHPAVERNFSPDRPFFR